jgi:hypothetical protein
MSAGVLAGQATKLITERLSAIERLLHRQLELAQSNRRNALGSGSVAGGGTIGVAPGPIVNANPKRTGLSVQNNGAAGNLTLGLGTTQPQSGTGLLLAPGASWDGRVSGALWLGSVSVVGSTTGVVYSWLEA